MPGRGLEPQEDQDCYITLSTASDLRTRTRSSRRRRLTDDREEAPRKPMTPSGQQLMALEYRLFCAEAPRFFPQPVLSRPCSPGGRMLGAERLSAELAEAMREEMLAKAPARNPPPATHKGAIDTSKRRPGSPADDPRGRKLHRSIRFPDKAALPRKRLPGETKTDGEADAEAGVRQALAESQDLFVVDDGSAGSSDEAADEEWRLVQYDRYADMPVDIRNGEATFRWAPGALASTAGVWGGCRSTTAVPLTSPSTRSRCMPPLTTVGERRKRTRS